MPPQNKLHEVFDRYEFSKSSFLVTGVLWGAILVLCLLFAPSDFLSKWNATPKESSPAGQANPLAIGSDPSANAATLNSGADTALASRVEQLETSLKTQTDLVKKLEEQASDQASRQAVDRARGAVLLGQVTTARQRLRQLRTSQSEWQAKSVTLLTGDPGRRIAGSPPHVELIAELLQQERPSPEQLTQWELELEALAGPLQAAMQTPEANLTLVPEHAALLADLEKRIVTAAALAEQQQRMLAATLQETAALPLHAASLQEVLRQRQLRTEQELAQRLATARSDARRAAEAAQVERLAEAERGIIDAQTKQKEQQQLAEKQRIEAQSQAEQTQIAEEERARQLQRQTTLAGLKAETSKLEETLRLAKLEREFAAVLPEAKTLLVAFLTPGFKHRPDKTKGPSSLGYLKSQGALDDDLKGLEQFFRLAALENDRPAGPFPGYLPGQGYVANAAKLSPLEKAQQILRTYGEVMVKQKLLDP